MTYGLSCLRNRFGTPLPVRKEIRAIIATMGGQKIRTEPSQTESTEPKPIQTEPKSISNHSVEDFPNANDSVLNRTEPRDRCVFVII